MTLKPNQTPPQGSIKVGDRVTFLQSWYGETHQFEGIVQKLDDPPGTALVEYKVPEHLQDGIERPNILQSPIALFSLKTADATVTHYGNKPESIDLPLLTRVLLHEAKQDLNSVPFVPVDSFGGQDQEDSNSLTPVFGQFWIEERYKTIKGKRYGPYKLKRWRDENGKKRSQSLGKTQAVDPVP